MTIEKLVVTIKGDVIVSSNSKEIYRATALSETVEEGDLCFATTKEDFQRALEKEAGVIVVDNESFSEEKNLSKSWVIKVEECKKAAFSLLSEVVDEEESSYELLDRKSITFLKMILKNRKNIEILPNDWQKSFDRILNSNKRLFVMEDEKLFSILFPKKKRYERKASGYVVSADSLFRTTFKIEKYIYQYKKMTLFHLEYLRLAVGLCQEYELPFDIDRVDYTIHFRPLFLEGEPSIQEVMKNDKVVIFSDNLEDILQARKYAADVGNWMAKTIVMVPPKTKVEGVKYPTYYRSNEEMVSLVGSLNYNYLFIYTKDKKSFEEVKREYLL